MNGIEAETWTTLQKAHTARPARGLMLSLSHHVVVQTLKSFEAFSMIHEDIRVECPRWPRT